jgi:peptide/nickel transport system permease protein
MVKERPLIPSLLAVLVAMVGIVEIGFGTVLITRGNLVPMLFPQSDAFLTGIVLLAVGFLGAYTAYNLWTGQAVGWVLSVVCLVVDMVARIHLPIVLGSSWTFSGAFLLDIFMLDVITLLCLTPRSATMFFGGESIPAVLTVFSAEVQPRLKEIKFTLRLVRKSPLSIVGGAIILFFVGISVLAPVLAPSGDISQQGNPFMMPKDGIILTPLPPSAKHPFGTMQGQYDIYYGCIWGTITAFRIGLYTEAGSLAIGLLMGILAAYYGGWIDEILMRLTDVVLAFPGLILSMALVVVIVPLTGIERLDAVMLSLVLVGWPGTARLIRGEILRIKNEDYVEAAKSVGCSDLRIITRHILPNSIFPVLIVSTLSIGGTVLAAAALSFLGIGATEGYADWGQIIALSRNWIYGSPANPYGYWYTFIIPGLFISTFVLGWNLLGDALRDIFDPTLRRK